MATLPPMTQLGGNYRALFEGYWSMLDPKNTGKIDAVTAAGFLKKSQLREPVLHKIWNSSDPTSNGYLDKQGFFMALRLIAVCQSGKEPSVTNMALSDPPPKLVGVETPPIALKTKWSIEASERTKYEKMFQTLPSNKGLLAGDKAKPFMLSSKLPLDTLGKIWTLSDIDHDGSLDIEEFCVAMKLISIAKSGEILPASLPSSLLPPSKGSSLPASSSAGVLSPPIVPTTRSASPKSGPSPSHVSPIPVKKGSTPPSDAGSGPEWVVNSEMKAKYDGYFQGIDKDHDGYISGEEARSLFMASNLQQPVLAHIWNLCDIEKNGRLNSEQFALAMYLIAERVRKKEVPKELTPAMIPPSLRGKALPISSTSLTSSSSSSSSTFTSAVTSTTSLAWSTSSGTSTGPSTMWVQSSEISTTTAPPTTTSIPWTTPTSSVNGGGGSGFSTDFSAIQELDSISNEIDSLRKEKSELAEDIKIKQELIQQRRTEIEEFQDEVGQAANQREALEKEREDVRNLLDQLNNEKAKFEGQIAELQQKCADEREEIDRLKVQLSEQETSKRSQSDELEKLKNQLEQLRKEEQEYKKKVELGKTELAKLQKDNQGIHMEINQVRQKLENLKEEERSMNTAFTLYPPTTTPGSTPSSSVVNINDVGQLSAELHVPHLSEHDAISARATVGSSSPVSSLSGFSTNSHLEEGLEEGVMGKEEKSQQPDLFPSSTAGGADPFAAFSLPTTGDPFGGKGFSGKPSDLSSFDPFGGNFDAFKSLPTSSAIGEDLFSNDPFSSSQLPNSPSSIPAAAVDPFSGQDPFNSDPFSSSNKNSSQPTSLWGSSGPFDTDVFGQQNAQTPTDPFAGNDPFGDDPFAMKTGSTNGSNPFGGWAKQDNEHDRKQQR